MRNFTPKKYDYIPQSATDLQKQLYELAHQTNEAEDNYCSALETFKLLHNFKKEILGRICMAQLAKSDAGKERLGLVSEEWNVWLKGYTSAEANKDFWSKERDKLNRLYECARSLLSSENKIRMSNT